ncbi:MAG: hypothetical protein IKM08_06515 [Clostridia bacterium]|nr:hypothetical protein [Clostridia bacterium]
MTKSKASAINALLALIQTLVTSLVGLVLGRSILSTLGSGYNGINSTVTQIIGTLTVLEGGFTLASNVALFAPFGAGDHQKVNGILAATHRRFCVVGVMAFFAGLLLSVLYPLLVTGNIPRWQIAALMLTALVPTCVNLGLVMKYRVIVLTAQKEYIISLFSVISCLLGNGAAILLIHLGTGLLAARIAISLSLLLGYLLIALYCRKKYPYVNFKCEPLYEEIKGTRNVVMIKVMSVLYAAAPIVIISTIPEEGALLASVYAVYKTVIFMIKNSLQSLCAAPRLSFGALLAEGDLAKTRRLFEAYEMVACMGLCVMLGATAFLLFPFVGLYTAGITDVDYHNLPLAVVMLSAAFIEILHIPSGQIIQMKGEFRVARNMQAAACAVLLLSALIGRLFFGIVGIVASVLLAALVLAVAEIYWTGKRILGRRLRDFLRNLLPCALIFTAAAVLGLWNVIPCHNYVYFVLWGLITVIVLGGLTLLAYFCVRRREVCELMAMLWRVLRGSKKNPKQKENQDVCE